MNELEQAVLAAKTDEAVFGELVDSNRAWMLRTASEVTHRYITDSDDEWSVSLLAFSEAVQSYETEKGSFRAFAALVIRRRLLDHLRAESRHSSETSVTPMAFADGSDEDDPALQRQIRQKTAADADDTASRTREEIAQMQAVLQQYGFSFFDLAQSSPKSEKTKQGCGKAIRTLIASVILMAQMRLKRLLPIKPLAEQSGVVRKILERHRKYIIAAAEILDGDFPILAEYLAFIRQDTAKEAAR
ncbi:MAG: RNA polymerase subunit sigma [Oscillospiraceae bacterium]|nr:RNA polymerase subunit sigma [Oscillospiraceae bacterium]